MYMSATAQLRDGITFQTVPAADGTATIIFSHDMATMFLQVDDRTAAIGLRDALDAVIAIGALPGADGGG